MAAAFAASVNMASNLKDVRYIFTAKPLVRTCIYIHMASHSTAPHSCHVKIVNCWMTPNQLTKINLVFFPAQQQQQQQQQPAFLCYPGAS